MNDNSMLLAKRGDGHTESTLTLETNTTLAETSTFDFTQGAEPSTIKKTRTIRRLEGLLISMDDDEATVCFLQDGQPLEMVIPAHYLRKNGITERYQPFEFSEQEVRCDGYWQLLFLYKPLCEKNNCEKVLISHTKHAKNCQNY